MEPVKDAESERSVPHLWRPVLRQIVEAIRRGDATSASDVPGVAPVSPDTAQHIRDFVADYGETLVPLPDDAWDTSVVLWMDGFWNVLVDLWTEREGRSDMVLDLRVFEDDPGYRFEVHMVYVP